MDKCCSRDCLMLNCITLLIFNDPYLSPSNSGGRRKDLELFSLSSHTRLRDCSPQNSFPSPPHHTTSAH